LFSPDDRLRLARSYTVIWGRDEPMPVADFLAALPQARAIIHGTWLPGYTPGLVHAGKLQGVIEMVGGHHHAGFDYAGCFTRGIYVGSCAWAFGPSVAEHGLALALAAGRNIVSNDHDFRTGTERYLATGNAGSVMLWGKRVGFIGCGGLARSLQPLLTPFGVTISGFDPWLDAEDLHSRGIIPESIENICSQCTFIFVLAAPTRENKALLSRALLERLHPDAVLVVLSRAHVVDYQALTELVSAGRFKAGIDVHDPEPLPAEHPLRSARNAVLTGHLAGSTREGMHLLGRYALDDLDLLMRGLAPRFTQPADPRMVALKEPG